MSFNFNISLSGLMANQKQMQVAQNNIANATTEGYARQRLNLEASDNLVGHSVEMQIGSGVIATNVERLKDEMLIEQARNEKMEVGYYEEISRVLSDVEVVFGENDDGSISDTMSNFFNAWQELSKFPEENSYRLTLLGETEKFVNKVSSVYNQMQDLKVQMNDSVNVTIKEINDLTTKIANINKQITQQSSESPNALFDKRDMFIDQLSNLIDIKVTTDLNDPRIVNVQTDGVFLVRGVDQNGVKVMLADNENKRYIVANGTTIKSDNGKLGAQIKLENEYIPKYVDSLNEWVIKLAEEVNDQHSIGFGTDNSTGLDFFTGTTAGNLAINTQILNDIRKIATSANVDAPGNNSNAKALADIKYANVFNGNTVNIENYYNGIVLNMGVDLSMAKDNVIVHENVLMGIESQKQQIQGVSVDEEMTNLLQYQQIYTANSKMIKAINDTFDKLFNAVN